MAFGTLEIATMIEWLITQPGMSIICRNPGNRAMAKATVLRRIEVARILAGSRSAIVAGCARAQDLGVINGNDGRPDICAVAIFADVGRLWVQWPLAGRVCSVMAAGTIVDNIGMIEIRWQPGDSGMAVIAIVAAGDMRWVFANSYHAVMT